MGISLSSSRDYFTDVAFGLVNGHRRVITRGNNPDIDAAEDVWSGGGDYPWMTAATSLEVVSDSAADAAAGAGARTVLISGLNAAYQEISTTVTLNGLTPVAVGQQFFRINNVDITSAGSGKINAGNINVRDAGAGTVRAIVPTGYGTDRQSQFTVPAGYSFAIHQTGYSINRPSSVRDAAASLYVGSPDGFYRLLTETSVDGEALLFPRIIPFVAPEKTDLGIRCTSVSATNTDLTAFIVGILKSNTVL